MNHHGGCLCQNVRYKISGKPISKGVCYCYQCQKSGGAYGSPLVILYKNQFEVSQGAFSAVQTVSARGAVVTRNFCRDCGSHIFSLVSDIPEILTVKAVTLDDFKTFVPEYLVWTESAGDSCAFPAEVPRFSQNAPLQMLLGQV